MASGGPALYPQLGVSSVVNGKYVIERRLGGGGMAEVFLARMVGAEGVSRQVAIKRVLPGFSDRPEFAKMFIGEAQMTSRLQHPNIVSIVDFDRDAEGRFFLVLELIEGTDLNGLLATGPLPISLVIYLTTEILRGLEHAHEMPIGTDGVLGIIHRDVSPHNVLLSWEGAVKVSDFGIAKARAATSATASAFIKGKPAYMSPEQANGQPLDGRSDLFAVGVMLFEMLALRPLFAGNTTQETLARLLFSPIPNIRELRPDIPEDLAGVVAALLVRERDRRMPSAQAAVTALVACTDYPRDGRVELVTTLAQRFAGRAPSRSRGSIRPLPPNAATIGRLAPAQPAAARLPGPRTQTAPPRMQPVRRRRWWPLVVIAILLAAGGAVGGLVIASSHSEKSIATVPKAPAEATSHPPAASAPSAPAKAAAQPPPPTPPSAAPAEQNPVADGSGGSANEPKLPSVAPKRDGDRPSRPPVHRPSSGKIPDGIREIHL